MERGSNSRKTPSPRQTRADIPDNTIKEMASEPRNTNGKTREMEAGASDRGGPDEGWIGDDHRGYATYCQLTLRSDLLLRRWMRRWWQWIQRRAELRGGRSRGTGRHRRPKGRLKV
jgi:hypothetical protein